jgi:cell division protein FtsI (penicillin-binding protein 3)
MSRRPPSHDNQNDNPPGRNSVARRFGAPREAGVPRVDDVRITAPDLARRATMERTRGRIVIAACGFSGLFAALSLKLALATVIMPMQPKFQDAKRPEAPVSSADKQPSIAPAAARPMELARAKRAMIVDRNGEAMALSLPNAALIANPRALIDPQEAAHKLKSVLPRIDEDVTLERLADQSKQFVYLARQLTPREQLAVNALGIPGVDFERTERRRYPLGRVAAQLLGGVDVDSHGIAGLERHFDQQLSSQSTPLRLSLDVRAQAVVRDELSKAMAEFNAIGACGIVMDVRTGEIIAMVSLPDFDINEPRHAVPDERFNRAVTGVYEPGSTFKLQTAAMALDSGTVHIWNGFDATNPIKIGRFSINDFEGKHRWLAVPEIIAYSSNIGAARMAEAAGPTLQRAWMDKLGMMARTGVELPEQSATLFPAIANWKEAATLTIGFGHGIAVTPLHVVAGTAAVANGGVLMKPTLLAQDPASPPVGVRVMQQSTSDTMRKLMRLVVSDGFGKSAEVPGYFVGGKTGTAEKISRHGYNKKANVAAFMSVFPMNSPRYAVYMMLDEPKANASTHGYATAGWVAAPAAGRVIARIGPMLGVFPEIENVAAVQASLFIPLQPGRPANAPANVKPPAPAPTAKAGAPVAQNRPPASRSTIPPSGARPGAPPGPSQPAAVPTLAPPLQALRQDIKLRTRPDEGR